jgi:hypothetical protein
MPQYTLSGPHIKLYINNKIYKTVQSINFTVDYAEEGIYGIDSPYPQEIAGRRVTVSGMVNGIRLKNSGGLQGHDIRPKFTDYFASPYISIRVQDRSTGEDIIFIQNAKVSKEDHSIVSKSVYRLNFAFVGQIPMFALDRASA